MSTSVKLGQLDATLVLDTIINSTEECIVIVNQDARIETISRAYAEFLQIDPKAAIGKLVTDVIDNTRLHIVLKTGVAEIADIQEIQGESMIASRIPIIKDGKVLGAYGRVLFKSAAELNAAFQKISSMKQDLTLYKQNFYAMNRAKYVLDDIATTCPHVRELKNKILKIANTQSNVLILGESGTGKELFAHSIHATSRRAKNPFISINCGAFPADLLESELFGYEAGAFTGARKNGRIGLLKAAHKGTVFLDEISELPMNHQVKLLRFLQDKEIKSIGSNVLEKVDVRIIAATNQDLTKMIDDGKFRSDLYYRLSVVLLNIPPLRDRDKDIPLLAKYLIKKICDREQLPVIKVSPEAMECMQMYDWPGNVRELEGVLESVISFIGPDLIVRPEGLPLKITKQHSDSPKSLETPNLKVAMDEYEKNIILNALESNQNNKTKVAHLLGISRTSLYEKMKKHDIIQEYNEMA